MSDNRALTIYELNQRLSAAVAAAPGLRNVWVVGETSDLRMSGGHCYLELIDKDDNGATRSRIRAIIWANSWRALSAQFEAGTGVKLASGIKIMACVTASYHPTYGMSVNIVAINPAYTVGDAVRRRNEILQRLQSEGLLTLNREKKWPHPALRIAIISAQGAAGYGDFVNQLYGNPYRLAFETRLFAAVMQGAQTVPSVMRALDDVEAQLVDFDGVVIIRGGGATTDLEAYDNYELAARIARYPIPVIVGIGHERDITVLDYVANMRVKTPTAAAEWLVARGKALLDSLDRCANLVLQSVSARIAGCSEQLARIEASLPGILQSTISNRSHALDNLTMRLTGAVDARLVRAHARLDAIAPVVAALAPEATLRRGFTITRTADGTTVRGPVPPGTTLHTLTADGSTITSEVMGL